MSVLPPIPSHPQPSHSHSHSLRPIDHNMNALLASSWRVMDQPPPPTLREILEAYKARGDGDREMLLAMLNAKTSEDQRLASLTTLHRTMLDIYQSQHLPTATTVPPLHVPDGHHSQYPHPHQFPSPPASYRHSPHPPVSQPLQHDHGFHAHRRTDSSSSLTETTRDRPATHQTRKRRRMSRSPPPHPRTRSSPSRETMPAHPHDLPPSPYSSPSSVQSSGGSPRSRESMAINSLLLSAHEDEDSPKGNTSSERSTTMASRER